jgi:hypothetical protein
LVRSCVYVTSPRVADPTQRLAFFCYRLFFERQTANAIRRYFYGITGVKTPRAGAGLRLPESVEFDFSVLDDPSPNAEFLIDHAPELVGRREFQFDSLRFKAMLQLGRGKRAFDCL